MVLRCLSDEKGIPIAAGAVFSEWLQHEGLRLMGLAVTSDDLS